MDTGQSLGEWLKNRRRQLDLTQKELADRSSCSVVTIRKIEQGDRRPSRQLAELMALALQVPDAQIDDFVVFARRNFESAPIPPAMHELIQSQSPPFHDATKVYPEPARPLENRAFVRLPRPSTPFLGREVEIAELLDYVVDPTRQLVSILGPGGMGKTRLALAVAERVVAANGTPFVGGCVFVSLAALTEGAQIAPAIVEALTMSCDTRQDTTEQLRAYLSTQRILLVIDNCEHLLDGIGLLVEIVQSAPGVTVLATSRERLQLQGEQTYPIQGLGVLDPIDLHSQDVMAHPAVQLFQETAQRTSPTYVLTVNDLPHVARICHLVSGMPLGIELSAGWVDIMSVSEIVSEVQRNLDFLSTNLRDLPARHRSMRAVFDASWQHLDPIDRSIFGRLSIFRGGFTRQTAAAVANAKLHHLGHLIHKSLLQYDRTNNRYWMHELLQQYSAAKLSEDIADSRATLILHRDYFVERLIACWDRLRGEDQVGALAELDADIDNFRLAWRSGIDTGQVARLRPAMDALGFYLEWRFHPEEGYNVFQRLTDSAGGDEYIGDESRATFIRALTWQAAFLRQSGKPDVAIGLLDRAERLCDHPTVDARTQQFEQAFIAYQRGYCLERRQNEQALACFRKSVELWEDHGDPWWVALGLGGLGYNLSWSNRFVEAREQLSRSVEIFEGYGHGRELVFLHNRLSDSCTFKGDLKAARRHGERALSLARRIENQKGQADALRHLARLASLDGRLQDAETQIKEAITIYRSLGVQLDAALAIATDGKHQLIRGDVAGANRRFLEAMDLFNGQQLRQGEGYILRWLSLAAVINGQRLEAKKMIEHSIEIFSEVGSYNYIPHLRIIHFLIAKDCLPPLQAKTWLAEILQHALEIREFFDVYWALSAIAYVLLINDDPAESGRLPSSVSVAVAIREFIGESLEFGRSAYMRALVHNDVDGLLARWPQQEIVHARALRRELDVWAFAQYVLESLQQSEASGRDGRDEYVA